MGIRLHDDNVICCVCGEKEPPNAPHMGPDMWYDLNFTCGHMRKYMCPKCSQTDVCPSCDKCGCGEVYT